MLNLISPSQYLDQSIEKYIYPWYVKYVCANLSYVRTFGWNHILLKCLKILILIFIEPIGLPIQKICSNTLDSFQVYQETNAEVFC